jgi:hypothetical protein
LPGFGNELAAWLVVAERRPATFKLPKKEADVSASSRAGQSSMAPVIPHGVGAMTIAQIVLSDVLLFLFGVALRNRFRIR